MRSMVIAVCVLGIPWVTLAQATKSSWTNLNSLQPGQKVQVVEWHDKKNVGTFLSATDAAITIHKKSGERTIQRQEGRMVRLMKNEHRLRNTLIGAGAGAGVGAGIGAAAYRQKCGQGNTLAGGIGVICGQPFFSKGFDAAFGAAVGFLGGAGISALWPTHEIIYRVADS
jgi:hypothetical protein